MKFPSLIIKAYFGVVAVLGLASGLSYVLMPWKLAWDGCYGFFGFFAAKVVGVGMGILAYLLKLFAWPYGAYVTATNGLDRSRWIAPGFYAQCGG